MRKFIVVALFWEIHFRTRYRPKPTIAHAPPTQMIKLTQTREITPYLWVHADEER
jgi:hypothetical protein